MEQSCIEGATESIWAHYPSNGRSIEYFTVSLFSTFPIQKLSIALKDGTVVDVDEGHAIAAQRYAPFAWGKLKQWCTEHVQNIHKPPVPAWSVAIGAGSMSSVGLAFSMFLNSGDIMLLENYSFSAAIDWLVAGGVECVPVVTDREGLSPQALQDACNQLLAQGKCAKALYIVPVGQNPTGTRLAAQRHEDIYKIASRHNLVIIEDDAYFYLQHRANRRVAGGSNVASASDCLPGLTDLGRSFIQ